MKLRSPYGEDREVPSLGVVVRAGAVVDVPRDLVESFLAGGWAPPAPAKKKRSPSSPVVTDDTTTTVKD